MRVLALILLFLLASPPNAYSANRYQALGVPKELVGSDESMAKQNEVADRHGFVRLKNLAELQLLVCAGALEQVLPARDKPGYYVTADRRFRYARPWGIQFLNDISKKFFDRFGKPLKITELVRTAGYQRLLVRRGMSHADGSLSERQSAHLVGAIDISKKPLATGEVRWLRGELVYLENKSLIEATEEIYNNAFHVMVFPSYAGLGAIITRDEEMIKKSGCEIQKPVARKTSGRKGPIKIKPDK